VAAVLGLARTVTRGLDVERGVAEPAGHRAVPQQQAVDAREGDGPAVPAHEAALVPERATVAPQPEPMVSGGRGGGAGDDAEQGEEGRPAGQTERGEDRGVHAGTERGGHEAEAGERDGGERPPVEGRDRQQSELDGADGVGGRFAVRGGRPAAQASLERASDGQVDVAERGLGAGPAGGLDASLGEAQEPPAEALADVDGLDASAGDMAGPPRDDAGGEVERLSRQRELDASVGEGCPAEPGEPDDACREPDHRQPVDGRPGSGREEDADGGEEGGRHRSESEAAIRDGQRVEPHVASSSRATARVRSRSRRPAARPGERPGTRRSGSRAPAV